MVGICQLAGKLISGESSNVSIVVNYKRKPFRCFFLVLKICSGYLFQPRSLLSESDFSGFVTVLHIVNYSKQIFLLS